MILTESCVVLTESSVVKYFQCVFLDQRQTSVYESVILLQLFLLSPADTAEHFHNRYPLSLKGSLRL